MELSIMFKIKEDRKQYDYLRKNSYWYEQLNRNPDNYKKFLSQYKKNNRNEKTNKVNDTINNIGTITNLLKLLE